VSKNEKKLNNIDNQVLIETERLILRNINLKDLDTFLEYRNDPNVGISK